MALDDMKKTKNFGHVMPDNKVEGLPYVGCDRLKDGETCWRDDGMAAIGKDEIEGA